jgi:hypothetical protein
MTQKKTKSIGIAFAIGIGIGIILYKVFFDLLWPVLVD